MSSKEPTMIRITSRNGQQLQLETISNKQLLEFYITCENASIKEISAKRDSYFINRFITTWTLQQHASFRRADYKTQKLLTVLSLHYGFNEQIRFSVSNKSRAALYVHEYLRTFFDGEISQVKSEKYTITTEEVINSWQSLTFHSIAAGIRLGKLSLKARHPYMKQVMDLLHAVLSQTMYDSGYMSNEDESRFSTPILSIDLF